MCPEQSGLTGANRPKVAAGWVRLQVARKAYKSAPSAKLNDLACSMVSAGPAVKFVAAFNYRRRAVSHHIVIIIVIIIMIMIMVIP